MERILWMFTNVLSHVRPSSRPGIDGEAGWRWREGGDRMSAPRQTAAQGLQVPDGSDGCGPNIPKGGTAKGPLVSGGG